MHCTDDNVYFVFILYCHKGAFGEKQYVSDMYRHAQNQITWLKVMEREEKEELRPVKFKGLALTGVFVSFITDARHPAARLVSL